MVYILKHLIVVCKLESRSAHESYVSHSRLEREFLFPSFLRMKASYSKIPNFGFFFPFLLLKWTNRFFFFPRWSIILSMDFLFISVSSSCKFPFPNIYLVISLLQVSSIFTSLCSRRLMVGWWPKEKISPSQCRRLEPQSAQHLFYISHNIFTHQKFVKGLASHCYAKTTFTFHFFIINA